MKTWIRSVVVLVLSSIFVLPAFAAERHWVGNGTGNGRFWDRAANWSATAGGAGGAGVPTAADDVFIDGGGNCQVNTNAVCLSFSQTVSTGTRDFAQNATLTVGSGGLLLTGGFLIVNSSNNVITVAGDWTQTGGTFNSDGGSIVFNGTSPQTITTLTSFNNVTINNASGVVMNSDLTVTGLLTFTSGVLTTGNFSLMVSPTGSVVRTSGHVNGNLTKNVPTGASSLTFEIGGPVYFTPVDVAFANVTTSGDLTAEVFAGEHYDIFNSPLIDSADVNRYWTFTSSGVVFTTYNATFHFDPTDVDAGANTNNFVVGQYDVGTWSLPTVGTKTATSTQVTGLTGFSDFAVGEAKTVTIASSAGANGSISPSGSVTVAYAGNQSYTITPDANYHILDVLVDGSSVGAVTNYSFTNVIINHTITASFAIDTYTITASAGANGSITPAGSVSVDYGSDTTFTITPNTGYHIADVLVDGLSVGAVTSHSFTNVTANHTIAASFAIDTYTITATTGSNGSISPSGSIGVDYGSDTTFTITPAVGYHVADVLVDGISVGAVPSHTFTNVTVNHTIDASFAIDTHTIMASAGANGSISPSGNVTVTYGMDTTFMITPDVGYFVADVFVDSVSVGSVGSHTFTNVTADHTISATFSILTYTITATAGSGGTITPSGSVNLEYGSERSFAITPDAGYHVADVLVDGLSVGAVSGHTFTNVTANHTIDASFAIDTHTITASSGAHGSLTPSGTVTVNYGSDTGFTITPDVGYFVADVFVDTVSVGPVGSYTFTNVTEDHTISAAFSLLSYTITATAGAGGSISPSGAVGVDYGSDTSFTITPDPGYHVADVLVDGLSVGAVTGHAFTNVTANHTIDASIAVNTYTITASAGAHGMINPSGSVTVNHGVDQHFMITPDVGYFVADVFVDSVSVGAVGSYDFTNVTENHTIGATFSILTYSINASAGAGGSISPSGAVSVNYGADTSFTITPDVGYFIADVFVDTVSVGAVGSHTFTNVTANHTISAQFSILSYTITAAAGANGTISPSGAVGVSHGDSRKFTITPDVGYFVADVFVDSVSVGPTASYTFTNVTQPHTIEATFAIQTFTMTSIAGTGGTISPSGSAVVNYGDSKSYSITANTGYFIADVHVDSFSVGPVSNYTFTSISQSHLIEAYFALQTFTITSSAGPGGTISPLGSTVVNYGDTLTFTIIPDAGYFISSVHVDTGSVGQVSSYTFSNVQANHNISALFGSPNTLPSAPALIAPLDGDTVYLDLVGTSLDFIWHMSVDPDAGDTVRYTLNLTGSSLDTTLVGLSDTVMSWSIVNLLQPGHTYRWTVLASDGQGSVASPDTFSFYADQAVGVKDAKDNLPKVYALHQNYPNPFNPTTVVRFDLPHEATVTVIIYNILGQEVAKLVNRESMDAGYKDVVFDASVLPSGAYLYRISAEEAGGQTFVSVKKMVYLK